nr:uncharacterized protein LOC109157713 [Ipomoea batatas]
MCKQSVSDFIATYSDKQKQKEMIDALHNYCSRLFDMAQLVEVLQLLLKACDSAKNFSTKFLACRWHASSTPADNSGQSPFPVNSNKNLTGQIGINVGSRHCTVQDDNSTGKTP